MLRNIVVIFALMAMLNTQTFAQNTGKIRCYDKDCVTEILNKLISPDQTVADDARTTLDEMAMEVLNYRDSRMAEYMMDAIILFAFNNDDNSNNAYIISILSKCCTAKDARVIMKMTENEKLADYAIRAVGDIDGAGDVIRNYILNHHDDVKYKAALAYAVGKHGIKDMENELISWLKGADDKTKIEIYNALLVIRSNEKTTKIIAKGAKKLNKSKIVENKIAGMRLLVALNGEQALPALYDALKNENRTVRVEALNLMKPFVNQDVVDNVVKRCNNDAVKIDVVNWLGDIKNDSQMTLVISQLSSADPEAVSSAIRAIYKIDNADGLNAVKPMFGGDYQDVIQESLLSYEGNYREALDDILRRGDDTKRLAALKILELRPSIVFNSRVKELVYSIYPDVKDLAFKVLPMVVMPANAEFLKSLLEMCDQIYVESVQIAIKNAMCKVPDNIKDNFVLSLKYVKPDMRPRYYKVFAYFGTELSVDKLIEAAKTGPDAYEAKEALQLVNNGKFADKISEALK